MKIYIADLAEYNAGNLYGKWLDLDDFTDADELKDAVYSVPKINPYSDGKERNEWAVHDYELDYDPDPERGKANPRRNRKRRNPCSLREQILQWRGPVLPGVKRRNRANALSSGSAFRN